MTQDEIQEEAGILDLACAQLGQELAAGRLKAAKAVHERLGLIVRKLQALNEQAKALAESKPC